MPSFGELDIGGVGGGNRVTNAIATASRRTGVDFTYLFNQAKIESSLNPNARASTSSATGLYQFIDQSWLGVINDHGAKHGLGWAADAIGKSGGHYYVTDPALRQQIMDLRTQPEVASIMAAEHAADNQETLESRLGRAVTATDLYLAHFLGVGGAAKFLRAHDQNPGASAAAVLPSAAAANRWVFYDRNGAPRSLAEVRQRFAEKLGGDGNYLPASSREQLPEIPEGQPVQPADYVRIETARLESRRYPTIAPQPETARLAYLMLATFGR
ncbi:lytic transglycosylase domain-containing protein [Rhizorhapis sp.]|uniref:lytic transglycosylase domain-containing protein n=1 Tax=Rhizorhapis sp. TaxID=1968842 RepID=UPI002B487E2F|nr:lytic transglycosylase domain-containing protein [Rhizorhapis sp.]HKR18100.1 lytic transglycosylase domain-containing protein [Rhizorhapis sp.]